MLKWIGTGKGVQGLPNIPARDLTQVEVVQYGGERALLATGLYVRIRPPKTTKKDSPSDD